MNPKMTDAEYAAVQQVVLMVAGLLHDLDLPGFLARVERCESLALIVDPLLYIAGGRKLESIKRLAVAARAMQQVVEEVMRP